MVEKERVPNNWKVHAKNFVGTILANVDNTKLSDAEFRQFIRNSPPNRGERRL